MDIIIVSILLFIIIGIVIALVFFYIDYTALKDTIITKETALNAKFNNYSSTSNITSNILTAHSQSIQNVINPRFLDTNSNFDTINAFTKENLNNINNLTNNFYTIDSNLKNMFGITIDTENNSRFPNDQIFKYTVTENGAFNDFSLMEKTIINGGLTIKGLTKMCDVNAADCFTFSNFSTDLNINADNNLSYLNINTKTKLNNELYSCDSSGNNCYTGIHTDDDIYTFHKKQPDGVGSPIYSIIDNKLNITKDKLILKDNGLPSFTIKRCEGSTSNLCFDDV
jgi:hypothetical protein